MRSTLSAPFSLFWTKHIFKPLYALRVIPYLLSRVLVILLLVEADVFGRRRFRSVANNISAGNSKTQGVLQRKHRQAPTLRSEVARPKPDLGKHRMAN